MELYTKEGSMFGASYFYGTDGKTHIRLVIKQEFLDYLNSHKGLYQQVDSPLELDEIRTNITIETLRLK